MSSIDGQPHPRAHAWADNHKLAQISNSATNDVVAFAYGPDDERVKKSIGPSGDTYDTVTVFPFYQIETGCLRADVDCDCEAPRSECGVGGDVDVMDIQKVAGKFNTTYAAYEQNGVSPITVTDIGLVAEKWLWEGAGAGPQIVKTYSLGGRTVAIKRGGELTYLFQDHLGSPALETDDAGNPRARWTYEPYSTMRGTEWTGQSHLIMQTKSASKRPNLGSFAVPVGSEWTADARIAQNQPDESAKSDKISRISASNDLIPVEIRI